MTPTPPPQHRPSRLPALDVLRGLAILLVLGRHCVIASADAGWLRLPAGAWVRGGWSGVDLFFVLSGFLIGGLLIGELRRHGRLDLWRFVSRRGMRIWPLYYLYLAGVAVFTLTTTNVPPREVLSAVGPSLLHVQNYTHTPFELDPAESRRIAALPDAETVRAARPFERTHLWSLAVEEHFYLLLPVVLVALTAHAGPAGLRWLPAVVAAVCAGCLAIRVLYLPHVIWWWNTHVYQTHIRIDGLAFGVLLAWAYHLRPALLAPLSRRPLLTIAAGVVLLATVLPWTMEKTPFVWMWGFTIVYIGYGLLLVGLVMADPDHRILSPVLRSPPLRLVAWIGTLSYPIYLLHKDVGQHPVQWMLRQGLLAGVEPGVRWLVATALYLAMAVAAGWLAYRLIERPLLLVRDRLFPSRSAALPTPRPAPIPQPEPAVA